MQLLPLAAEKFGAPKRTELPSAFLLCQKLLDDLPVQFLCGGIFHLWQEGLLEVYHWVVRGCCVLSLTKGLPIMLMFQIHEQNKPLAGYIYQKFMPNVGIYRIHGSYGIWSFRKMHRYRNLELVCISTPTCCCCTVDGRNLVAPGMCNCCN